MLRKLCFSLLLLFCMIHCITAETIDTSNWQRPLIGNWHLTWDAAQKVARQKGKKVLAISYFDSTWFRQSSSSNSSDSVMFLKEITQKTEFRNFIDQHFEVFSLQYPNSATPESQRKYYWNTLRKMELGWTHPGFSVLNTEGSVCERTYNYESMTKLITFLEKALNSSPGDYKSREAKERERLKELFKSAEFEIIGWGTDRENITSDGKLPETLNSKQRIFIKARYSLPEGVRARRFSCFANTRRFRSFKYGTFEKNGTVIFSTYTGENGLIERITFYASFTGMPFHITVKEIPCRIEVKEGAAVSSSRNTASRRSSSSSSVSSPRQESGSAAAGSDWVKPPLPNWHLTWESAQKAAMQKGKKVLAITYFDPTWFRKFSSSNSYPGYHESAMLIKEITQKTEFRNFIDQHFEVFSLQYPNSATPESQRKYYWNTLRKMELGWTHPGFSVLNTEGSVCERIYNYESMTKLMTFLEKTLNSSPGDYKSREAKERERLKELFKSAEFEIIGWGTDRENITSDGKLPETLNSKQRIFIKARYSLPEGVRVRRFSCFANTRRFRSLEDGTFEKNGTVIFSTYTGENGLIKRITFYAGLTGVSFRITVKEIPCRIEVKEGAAVSSPRNTASRRSSPRQESGSTAAGSDWVKPPLPNWHLTWESAQKAAMQKGKKVLAISSYGPAYLKSFNAQRSFVHRDSAMFLKEITQEKKFRTFIDKHFEVLFLQSIDRTIPESQRQYYWNTLRKTELGWTLPGFSVLNTEGSVCERTFGYDGMTKLMTFLEKALNSSPGDYKSREAKERERLNELFKSAEFEIIGWGTDRENITNDGKLPETLNPKQRIFIKVRYSLPQGVHANSFGVTSKLFFFRHRKTYEKNGTVILSPYPREEGLIEQITFHVTLPGVPFSITVKEIPCRIEVKEGAAVSSPRNTASRKSSSSSAVSSPRQESGSTAAGSDWVKPPLPNWHLTWESAQKAAREKGKKILVIVHFSRYKQTRITPYSWFPGDKKLMQLFDTHLETLYLELSSVYSLPEEQKKYNNSVKEKFNLQEGSYTIFETDGTQITQLPYYTDMEDLKDFLETGALCTAEELKIIAREKEKENAMLSRQVKIEIIGWGSSREDITLTPQLPAKWEQGKRLYLKIRYEFPPLLRGSITSSRGSTPYLQDRGTTILGIYPKKGDKHIRQLNFSLLTIRPGKTYPLPPIPCSIEIIPEQ